MPPLRAEAVAAYSAAVPFRRADVHAHARGAECSGQSWSQTAAKFSRPCRFSCLPPDMDDSRAFVTAHPPRPCRVGLGGLKNA